MIGALAGLALALTTAVAAPAAPQETPLIFSITEDEVVGIGRDLGWKVVNRTRSDEAFRIDFLLPDDTPVTFTGVACDVDGEPGCPEWSLDAYYGVGRPERAAELERRISYSWASDWADGEVFSVGRMDFLYGGVSRDHLRASFATFADLVALTTLEVFPCGLPKGGVAPECAP